MFFKQYNVIVIGTNIDKHILSAMVRTRADKKNSFIDQQENNNSFLILYLKITPHNFNINTTFFGEQYFVYIVFCKDPT